MHSQLSRLDILIYAHDGRGLGHVGRSAAIGLALRRLFPELKVLLVTGAAQTRELVGTGKLDWLKLPAYATEIVAGKSRGISGPSGFEDRELGELRALQLKTIIEVYRPRLVLVDHTPQGKHKELLPAVQQSSAKSGGQTHWVLGVRGVVGEVTQAGSELARTTFQDGYHDLLWYGDSTVLGDQHLRRLEAFYKIAPFECGYVARLGEVLHGIKELVAATGPAATVSIPWQGEHTAIFLEQLVQAIDVLGAEHGAWNIFCDQKVGSFFKSIPHCHVLPFSGTEYVRSLATSRLAVIFGGYNSLVDVLSLGVPTLVVMREMVDNEQHIHLEQLHRRITTGLYSVGESHATTAMLVDIFKRTFQSHERGPVDCRGAGTTGLPLAHSAINLAGAKNAAVKLRQIVQEQSHE